MRKRILSDRSSEQPGEKLEWLEIASLAEVELTSEDPEHPIEAAFSANPPGGWRASSAGRQTIRLRFDEPQDIARLYLVFCEESVSRTQEFTLSWRSDQQPAWRELVRQQFNFSPPETKREVEEFQADLPQLRELELSIVPEISGGEARASLWQLRLGKLRPGAA